jgi:hypothetical protein
MSLSGRSFFDLSSEYKKIQLDEIYYLSKHANFSYSDILIMPVFERKYFINKLVEEFDKRNEMIEKQKNKQ